MPRSSPGAPTTTPDHSGATITEPEAATYMAGWFRGGVLRHVGLMGFITAHGSSTITLAGRLPELEVAIAGAIAQAQPPVPIEPGCDLRRETRAAQFDNLLNYGRFPDIPRRNPFGGGSII